MTINLTITGCSTDHHLCNLDFTLIISGCLSYSNWEEEIIIGCQHLGNINLKLEFSLILDIFVGIIQILNIVSNCIKFSVFSESVSENSVHP